MAVLLTVIALVITKVSMTVKKNDPSLTTGSVTESGTSQVAPTQHPVRDTTIKANTARELVARKLAEGEKPNRLLNEKSPYLLQHAFNPVDWYPWGEEAFEKARREDKPIFLSIGYSTCYWCHVMEREVFEDDSIAALMNRYVVSIKVDREERPDVDRVYMTALQAMTGSGGWPMSMFLTPDLQPFYGATYIPPEPRYGRPGFPTILTAIHEAWVNQRQDILANSRKMADYLSNVADPQVEATDAGITALERGFNSFSESYDSQFAGFGSAPKFPRPAAFNFLLRYYSRTGDERALNMSLETLKQMARGGMYDHMGGGFHRYATDARWRVPHFEKMLYDQAQLVISFLEAHQITHDPYYAHVVHDVLSYVLGNMTHPDGGFYSAEDAESAVDPTKPDEKEEGAFYTWKKSEIDGVLLPPQAEVFAYHYGVTEKGNAESDPHEEFVGENILFRAHEPLETARKFDLSVDDVESILTRARETLFRVRETRPKPHLDDKILVSWNGLMISAFARAYQVLDNERYRNAAERSAQFILDNLYDRKGKKLLRRYRDGESRYDAHLEDYAFFTQGLLDLYEASLDIRWLQTAMDLTEQQNKLFYDRDQGGFYDISGADESILIRTKEWYDGAEPTGNSIAILNLLRLSQMTDNQEWATLADQSLRYFGSRILSTPQGLPQFLVALDFSLSKPKQIIIAGKANNPDTKGLLKEVHSHFIPNKIILLVDDGKARETLASYVPFIETVEMLDGKATAYICENYACELPTSDREVVAKLLTRKN
ncbi:MAG: thioredoxin domain-containing protein [Fidelibacterota bacterium]